MSYGNNGYPTDHEAKQAILEVGRRMYAKNFVASNDGNITRSGARRPASPRAL